MDPYEIVEQGGVPELTEWLRGLVVGSITVLDVEYDVGADARDLPGLYVHLTLTDPVPGLGWPAEDILELTRRVYARCNELKLPNWYVRPHSRRSRLQKVATEAGGQ